MTDTMDEAGSDTADEDRPTGRWRAFQRLPVVLRVTTYVAVGLVLVLVAGLATATVLVRRPLPQTSGTIKVATLEGEVEVLRDESGIPQIYADSVEDLMRGQGYVHAQDRFFEMDVRRHATAGRLAEMFGEDAVESDRYVRTMGWRRVAEAELALVTPDTRAALEAYADGVNAYLGDNSPSEIAVEYSILNAGGLGYQPEDWTPVDSLAWLKAMAWDLRGNMTEEIDRVLAASVVGVERAAGLWPSYPFGDRAPIVGQGAVVDGVFEQDATSGGTRNPQRPAYTAGQRDLLSRLGQGLDDLPAWLGRGDGIGSNSWVIAGDLSATGMPILANDPHLGVSMPGVWTQVGLHCRVVSEACPMDVAGFSFSGVPGVIIGHNADIAWGFTNLGPDVTDLFVERVVGDSWRQDGELRPLQTRTETIAVQGADDVELTVRSTAHGPLISDVSEEIAEIGEKAPVDRPLGSDDEYAVALSWTALRPAPTADAILELDLASDWDSFRAAASSFAVPAQNMVYADREGHIGYQAPGLVPIRKSGNDGSMPSAGWRSENDWSGDYIPFDGLPSVLDPDQDFVVAANQALVRGDYPYYLTDDFDRGYRSERIRDLLIEEGDLSITEMSDLQLDNLNPMASTLTPYLLDVELPGGYFSAGVELLEDWDFTQDADSGAAAYYNVVWRNLLELTYYDELPEELWPDGGQRWYAVMEQLLQKPASEWWDDVRTDDVVEGRDDIIELAVRAARDEMTSRQALNPDEWTWGALHELDLRSATLGESGIGPIEWLLNRGGWELPGGSAAVDAASWDAAVGYDVTSAASMRMVVSLEDLDESRWVNLTGVSGHPASDNYTDQTDLWAAGGTLGWAFTREAVEAGVEDTLTLVPAGG